MEAVSRIADTAVVAIEAAAIEVAVPAATVAIGGQLASTLDKCDPDIMPQLSTFVATAGHARLHDPAVFAIGTDLVGAEAALDARHGDELEGINLTRFGSGQRRRGVFLRTRGIDGRSGILDREDARCELSDGSQR